MSDKPAKVVSKSGHTYHKSSSANATVAPTNEATKANATKQGNMTAEQLDFVTIVDYEYSLTGELPTKQRLVDEYRYKPNEVIANYTNDLVIQALNERGVSTAPKFTGPVGIPSPNEQVKPSPKLTAIQLVVANKLLDLTDTRSERKKLQDLDVSTTQYQAWLRDPDFSDYLRQRAELLLGDMQHEAMLALLDNVKAGKMDAVKYYHEMTGRFTPASANQSGGNVHDLQTILVRVIEIIDAEIDDPLVLARIGDRLKALVMGGQLAGMLPTPVVHQPEIAKPREQTPQVQELMRKGIGVNS